MNKIIRLKANSPSKRILAGILSSLLCINGLSCSVFAEEEIYIEEFLMQEEILLEEDIQYDIPEEITEDLQGVIHVTDAEELPTTIPAGTVVLLDNDLTLAAGQQIGILEGTLDGQGHVIILADRPLVDSNLGLIQNLGVTTEETLILTDKQGPLVINQSGQILNCYSTCAVTTTTILHDVGGLVGRVYAGVISHCYVGGASGTRVIGGIAAMCDTPEEGTIITDCYYVLNTNYGPINIVKNCKAVNSGKKTAEEFADGSVTALLNTDAPDTGYIWTTTGGWPRLTRSGGVSEEEKNLLISLIETAELYDSVFFEENTYQVFEAALQEALTISQNPSAGDQAWSEARGALSDAMTALERIKPDQAVKMPEDTSRIKLISSAEDLAAISSSDKTSYYQLTNDIVIDSDYPYPETELNCLLDGNGYTIYFEDAGNFPFSGVGEWGIVQNICFSGTLKTNEYKKRGPLGINLSGTVVNSYSNVTGSYTSGFARALTGGLLSNCYAVGDCKSAFFEGLLLTEEEMQTQTPNTGTVLDSYWLNTIPASDLTGVDLDSNTRAMSEDEIKSIAFADLLNNNRGAFGAAWGQSAYGYPYFGENQTYDPEGLPLPDNSYEVQFTYSVSGQQITVDNHKVRVSPDEINGYRSVGDLTLVGLPEDSTVTWSVSEESPAGNILTGTDTGGRVTVFGEGKALLTAMETRADGSSREVAYVRIFSSRKKAAEIKLYIKGQDVTGSSCTVEGSEWFTIQPMIRYEDSTEFEEVLGSSFIYQSQDESMLSNLSENSGEFSFSRAGCCSITVSSRYTENVSAAVEIISSYVPVESIEIPLSSEIVIHGRNANSEGGKAYNPSYDSLIIKPENASNRSTALISSSDPAVAQYVVSMVMGYVPYKAGTTVFTAEIDDVDPQGNHTLVTAQKEVTFRYRNPVASVTMDADKITLTQGEAIPLPITITGGNKEEALSVTEPDITWTYSSAGIVAISQDSSGWKRKSTDADNNMYLPAASFTLKGLQSGTVTVTGTPKDPSYEDEPVVFTVTVVSNGEEAPDQRAQVEDGLDAGCRYIRNLLANKHAAYGDEWTVYILQYLRELTEDQKESYLTSVAAKASTWTTSTKPTEIEKTALVLTALGEDITDVGGVDLVSLICENDRLTSGSNELIYALLALDASGAEIPEGTLSRRDLVKTLIETFQCEDGGFGLSSNGRSDLDLTGMALQVLGRYTEHIPEADQAVEKALDYLRGKLSETYGYSSVETDAQVLLALAILQIDVTNPSNGFGNSTSNLLTHLLNYKMEDASGFCHALGGTVNLMASTQATEALLAYKTFLNGEKSFWNLCGSTEQISPDQDSGRDEDPYAQVTITADTEEEAAMAVREHFLGRRDEKNYQNDRFTYSYQVYIKSSSATYTDKTQGAAALVSSIRTHTGMGNQGDYFKENVACSAEGSLNQSAAYGYIVHIGWYFTTGVQEEALTQAIADFQKQYIQQEMTDFEKLTAIYDYICGNVSYAYAEGSDGNYIVYTAYGAMMDHLATCAGYASLLYRLCLTNGIDCRIIGGAGHARNIVKIDGRWFVCDSTWDQGKAPADYNNFLVGSYRAADMAASPDAYFNDIMDKYPVAETDYVRILTMPEDQKISKLGEALVFSTQVLHGAAYQWEYSKNGSSWYKSSAEGSKTPYLTLKASSSNYTNLYRCRVTGTDGSVVYTSSAGMKLTGLVITTQPRDYQVTDSSGLTAVYHVTAENAAENGYQWQYSKDGKHWYKSSLASAKSEELTVKISLSNMANLYRCRITGTDGTVKYSNAVCAKGVPVIIKEPVSIKAPALGTLYNFSVTTANPAEDNIWQWYYSKDGGTTWYKSTATGAKTPTLTIKATSSNSDVKVVYRCLIKASCGLSLYTDTVSFG